MEDKSMTRKLNLLWISAENKIRSLVEDFKTEAGAAEIVAIILIIVAVIAAAAIFKDRIVELVNNIFDKISLD